MLSELEIGNLQLRKVNSELQSKLMQIEYAKMLRSWKMLDPYLTIPHYNQRRDKPWHLLLLLRLANFLMRMATR